MYGMNNIKPLYQVEGETMDLTNAQTMIPGIPVNLLTICLVFLSQHLDVDALTRTNNINDPHPVKLCIMPFIHEYCLLSVKISLRLVR